MPLSPSEKIINERQNQLWMLIEEVELSFAYYYWRTYVNERGAEQEKWKHEYTIFGKATSWVTLLSTRKLSDFFTPPGAKIGKMTAKAKTKSPIKSNDDIKASDFGFRQFFSIDTYDINKLVAHLTVKGVELRSRGMPTYGYLDGLYDHCLKFFDHLESQYLDKERLADRQMMDRIDSVRKRIHDFRVRLSSNGA